MNTIKPETELTTIYQIRLEGHLDQKWGEWFSGLTITLEESGETLLTGAIIDQSALHGLLKKVRNLGMPLVSVVRIKPAGPMASKKVL